MSFADRLVKKINAKEKQIAKETLKLDDLKVKLDSHKLTRAQYNIKKKHIEEKLKAMNSRMRGLQGLLAKEKRHQEEREEEKQKKKEEKEKKKQKKQEKKESEELEEAEEKQEE